MSNGLIIRPVPLTPAQIGGGSSFGNDPSFPMGNLADPQPKVIYRTGATITSNFQVFIDIDLLADTFIDSVALLYTTASTDGRWYVQATTAAQGHDVIDDYANQMFASAQFCQAETLYTPRRRHGFFSGAGRAVRYVRIWYIDDIAVTANNFPRWQAGVVVVGVRWLCELPYANFELGAGRKITDLSDKRQLPGGEVGRWPKAKVASWRCTWSNMTDADLISLWSILAGVGCTEPLVLVEDPDFTPGLNERIHYCTIDSLDYYQRVQVGKSSIELKVTDWL